MLFSSWSQPFNTLKEGQRTQKKKSVSRTGVGGCRGEKSAQFIAVVTNYLSESSISSESFLPPGMRLCEHLDPASKDCL